MIIKNKNSGDQNPLKKTVEYYKPSLVGEYNSKKPKIN